MKCLGTCIAFLIVLPMVSAEGQTARSVGAGLWYPADGAQLRAAVEMYINNAQVGENLGRFMGCIVPNDSYSVSGSVMAHPFKTMKPGDYERVIILASSHHASFRNCSVPAVDAFRTPLGEVPVDKEAVRRLCWSPLFSLHTMRYLPDKLGERRFVFEIEHAIDVALPFLQTQLGTFKIVPILVGDYKTEEPPMDNATILSIAKKLNELMDDKTLIVVSSNMTRFGSSYQPFSENVIDNIRRVDDELFSHILMRDAEGFVTLLDESKNPIDGRTPIAILLHMLPARTQGVLLNYGTSVQPVPGVEPVHCVSYAAIGFYQALSSKEKPSHGHE